jgi:hypothetical protein
VVVFGIIIVVIIARVQSLVCPLSGCFRQSEITGCALLNTPGQYLAPLAVAAKPALASIRVGASN